MRDMGLGWGGLVGVGGKGGGVLDIMRVRERI